MMLLTMATTRKNSRISMSHPFLFVLESGSPAAKSQVAKPVLPNPGHAHQTLAGVNHLTTQGKVRPGPPDPAFIMSASRTSVCCQTPWSDCSLPSGSPHCSGATPSPCRYIFLIEPPRPLDTLTSREVASQVATSHRMLNIQPSACQ